MAEGHGEQGGAEVDPAALVDEWQRRAWADGDLGAVDELLAEPFVRHGLNGTTTRSRSEVKSDVCEFRRAFVHPNLEVHDSAVVGDKVWTRTTLRGADVHSGDTRTVERIQIYRVEGGLIAEVWSLHASGVDWAD